MKNIGLTLGIAFMLFSCTEAQETTVTEQAIEAEATINKVVTPEEFKKLMLAESAQLVDVRTPGEYSNGHIGDALNIDFMNESFDAEIGKMDKNAPMLIYCASGGRSGRAAQKLKAMGFTEVYDLSGGYNGWKQ